MKEFRSLEHVHSSTNVSNKLILKNLIIA